MTPQDKARVVIAFALLAAAASIFLTYLSVLFFNELIDNDETNLFNS